MFKPGKQDAVNFTGIQKSGSTQDAAMPIGNGEHRLSVAPSY